MFFTDNRLNALRVLLQNASDLRRQVRELRLAGERLQRDLRKVEEDIAELQKRLDRFERKRR